MNPLYLLLLALIFNTPVMKAQQWTWTQKNSIPVASGTYSAVSFSINNKIYVAGGCSSGLTSNYNNTWEYDGLSDSWTQKVNMPMNGTYGSSSFVLNNEGYVIGGWHRDNSSSSSPVSFNYKYNPY